MRWGLVALVCAACGGQGVDLEVDADVAFDRVELFVTYDVCHDSECDQGIGWPNQSSRAPGTVYVLSDDEKLIATTKLVGSAAVLHLEAAAGFEDTRAIAIAAYKGNHVVAATVLWSPRIPLHTAERWKVHLDTTEDATVKIDVAPAEDAPDHRALAWAREPGPDVPDPSGYAGCFVYQSWNGSEWESDYFVPETDMDCDGAPPDCTPFWNHFDPAKARCATSSDTSFCTLGRPKCTDETPGTTCMPTTPITCLPQEVCALCGDDGDLAACLEDQIASGNVDTDLVASAECRFAADENQGPCDGELGNTLQYKLLTTCPDADPVLREPAMPFSGGSAQVTTPDGAELEVTATSDLQSCLLRLEWKHGTIGMDYHFVLAVNLPARTMLVPVTIGLDDPMTLCPTTAEEPGQCVGHGANDTLFQCIRAP